jgi:hypothetical protein
MPMKKWGIKEFRIELTFIKLWATILNNTVAIIGRYNFMGPFLRLLLWLRAERLQLSQPRKVAQTSAHFLM